MSISSSGKCEAGGDWVATRSSEASWCLQYQGPQLQQSFCGAARACAAQRGLLPSNLSLPLLQALKPTLREMAVHRFHTDAVRHPDSGGWIWASTGEVWRRWAGLQAPS
jgi:hypothetical protein